MNAKLILTLFAMGLGVLVLAVDITAINLAIPGIEKGFKTSIETVQWVINGYGLSFGVLMVTCGRLADIYGRTKMFYIGLVVFGLASFLGAIATDVGMLIAARFVQGFGGALLWPAILGIVFSSVSDSQKGIAIGLIMGAAGFGNAAGPVLSGFITETWSWRWVLMMNIPLVLIAGTISYFVVEKQSGESGEKGVDSLGILTLSVSIIALLYALNVAPTWGWVSYGIFGLLLLSIAMFYLFIRVEKVARLALIPDDVLRNSTFMMAGLIMLLAIPSFFCVMLYVPQYFEKFMDYTPVLAGASLVPMLLSFGLVSPISGTIFNRLGPKYSILTGLLLITLGILALIILGFDKDYYGFIPGMVLMGMGIGFSIPSVTTSGVGFVSDSRASLASGILYMFQLVGAALGLAIATTIFTTRVKDDLLDKLKNLGLDLTTVEHTDIEGFVIGSGSKSNLTTELGIDTFNTLIPPLHSSYVSGIKTALVFTVVLAALGAVVALVYIPKQLNASSD